MKAKEFFGKFGSLYLWGNLLAMALVVVGLCFGVKYGLEVYTHHGEGIDVPALVNMRASNARQLLIEKGLELVVADVSDSGHNKKMPADCILAQSPGPGVKVKSGHIIYVTINSPSSPSFPIPDLIDNSSYREAEAKLTSLGFRLLPPKRITGERDWVYGIISRGRHVNTGDHVSIDSPLTLIIGNGQYGEEEDIDYTEASDIDQQYVDGEDEFVEIEAPETNDEMSDGQ